MALGFFTGDNAPESYESMERKRRLAELLMAQSNSVAPVQSWTQGAARIAQALSGKIQDKRLDARERENSAVFNDALMKALGGGSSSPSPVAPSQAMTSADAGGAAKSASFSGSQGDFVSAMLPHAMKVSQETGLDPRLVIAQSALETGYGKSAPGNNFFGIKSHGQPGGNTLATTEVVNGHPVKTADSFRAYGDMGQSASDYAAFLKSNPRYREVLGAQGLDGQIDAMARSGYATDPMYGNKLRQIASGIQLPQGQPAQVASLDGLPPGPVPSNAPPMAYAPAQQAISNAAPPMPPPRPQGMGGAPMPANAPAPNAAPAGPAPMQMAQAGGIAPSGLLQLALDPRFSPQQRQMAMQLYSMGQREEGVTTVDLGDRVAMMNKRGQVTGYLPKSQAPRGPVAVGPDQRLVDPNTGKEIVGASEGKAPTTRVVKQPDGSEVALQWDSKEQVWKPLNAPQGGNAVSPTLPKLTEQQSKDVGFYQRGLAANKALTPEAEKQLLSVSDTALQNLPEVMGMNVGRRFQNEKFQTAYNAGRNFLAVVLRKDTGAAITKEEWKEYTPLFIPQPGDTPELLTQKRENRKVALEAINDGLGNVGDVLARVMANRKQATPSPEQPAAEPKVRRYNPQTGRIE